MLIQNMEKYMDKEPDTKIGKLHSLLQEEMDPIDMQNLLGFVNQKNVYKSLNISEIMRLRKMDFDSTLALPDQDLMLTRRSITNLIMLICSAYFCMGTEL